MGPTAPFPCYRILFHIRQAFSGRFSEFIRQYALQRIHIEYGNAVRYAAENENIAPWISVARTQLDENVIHGGSVAYIHRKRDIVTHRPTISGHGLNAAEKRIVRTRSKHTHKRYYRCDVQFIHRPEPPPCYCRFHYVPVHVCFPCGLNDHHVSDRHGAHYPMPRSGYPEPDAVFPPDGPGLF
mgnify:CR=1 FL=1